VIKYSWVVGHVIQSHAVSMIVLVLQELCSLSGKPIMCFYWIFNGMCCKEEL